MEPAVLIMAGRQASKNTQSMEDFRLPGLCMTGIEYPISNKECPIMKQAVRFSHYPKSFALQFAFWQGAVGLNLKFEI